MSKPSLPGIDATDVRCPDFTVPVLRLLKKVGENTQCVIKTKEPNALMRLTHLCASYNWKVIGYKQVDELYYVVIAIGSFD